VSLSPFSLKFPASAVYGAGRAPIVSFDESNVLAKWSCNEPYGDLIDSVGSHDGDDENSVLSAAGKLGTSRLFTRANSERFRVTPKPAFPASQHANWSVSAWIYPVQNVTAGIIGVWESPNSWLFYFSGGSSSPILKCIINDGVNPSHLAASADNLINLNAWNHIVVCSSGDDDVVQLWHDGVKVKETAWANGVDVSNTAPVMIGCWDSVLLLNHFDGRLDQIRLHTEAVTPTQIATLYAENVS